MATYYDTLEQAERAAARAKASMRNPDAWQTSASAPAGGNYTIRLYCSGTDGVGCINVYEGIDGWWTLMNTTGSDAPNSGDPELCVHGENGKRKFDFATPQQAADAQLDKALEHLMRVTTAIQSIRSATQHEAPGEPNTGTRKQLPACPTCGVKRDGSNSKETWPEPVFCEDDFHAV